MHIILYWYVFSATSPGKLLQYLVEDGCHVDAKEPYAEIEVCINGCVTYKVKGITYTNVVLVLYKIQ